MALKAFSLFHFPGAPQEKEQLLCQLLDKDKEAAFEALCRVATYKLFEVAAEIDEVEENYSDEKLNQIKESVPKLYKIFDESRDPKVDDSSPSKSAKAQVAQKLSWVFDPSQLRDKLFEAAGVKVKHKLDQARIIKKLEKSRR